MNRPASPNPVARRTLVKGALWSAPVVTMVVAAPPAAAVSDASIEWNGELTAVVRDQTTVTGAEVTATRNPGQAVIITLPTGFEWISGGSAPATVGTGPGTHTVPDFKAGASAPVGTVVVTATTSSANGTVHAYAPIEVRADLYELAWLGGVTHITDDPDEYREDLSVIVPTGVRPDELRYSWAIDDTVNQSTSRVTGYANLRSSTSNVWAIVAVQDLGNGTERLWISARGDCNMPNDSTSRDLTWRTRLVWPGSTPDSVLARPAWYQKTGNSTGRLVGLNAYDGGSRPSSHPGPNAQTAWGNTIAAGTSVINANNFHIAATRADSSSNMQANRAYYQFIHEDGTTWTHTGGTGGAPVFMNPINDSAGTGSMRSSDTLLGNYLGLTSPYSITLPKAGYWKFVIWPVRDGNTAISWDPATEAGHQVGSVFWQIPGSII